MTRAGYATPRYIPYGDAALIIEFGDVLDDELSAQTIAADAALQAALEAGRLPGVIECAPSFRSVLITFDPLQTDAEQLAETARAVLAEEMAEQMAAQTMGAAGQRRSWRLPVCFDPEVGLDLTDIAARKGLTIDGVIEAYLETRWRVYMIGFLPGCPFMGRAPERIDLPRRAEPRIAVPARSVAIAVGLSVIYPTESPGGWNIVGRTPARLFDPTTDPELGRPTLFAPGDQLIPTPIDLATLHELEKAAAAGDWAPTAEPLERSA
ncbi:MAG: allophanate hydrolase subunit 1 [Neomegalonema sp.]|nr:allophanate hydrolase subunit 1 [Neomegalonema sp.]